MNILLSVLRASVVYSVALSGLHALFFFRPWKYSCDGRIGKNDAHVIPKCAGLVGLICTFSPVGERGALSVGAVK